MRKIRFKKTSKPLPVSVQLEPEQKAALERLAEIEDRSVSSIIRRAIRELIERDNEK